MNVKLARLLLGFLAFSPIIAFSQRGKDLDYSTTTANDVVNTYTTLTANAAAGSTSITVANNSLSGAHFSAPLAAGDLILIIQMQGASLNISTNNTTFTTPFEYEWEFPPTWLQDATKVAKWGEILQYNNCGNFEQVEVAGISGTNTIQLNCALTKNFTSSGKTQVVRIPRFNNLTLSGTASLVPIAWGTLNTGGVLAVEVNGNLLLNAGTKLSATGRGFRGAVADNVGLIGTTTPHTNGAGNGGTQMGAVNSNEGARKGEGVGGYVTEYTALFSNYGRGSAGNGGGGGGYQNAGGGGGANVGTGTYTGKGVPSSAYSAAAWNLELAGFATSSSAGGGRGGYSLANTTGLNPTVAPNGPNKSVWGADARKENGGHGGHPLAQNANRIFMGGGGGAGEQDNGRGGDGGAGGGIIFATVYGSITGTGTFEADGANGVNSKSPSTPSVGLKQGNDGAGGAGGGGSIYIKNSSAIPNTIALNARGGVGGNHALTLGFGASQEAGGPGGGGAGGSITFVSGAPMQNVNGGNAGICTVNSGTSIVNQFPVNGATMGANGILGITTTTYNITASNQSICAGSSVTLTASSTGTLPGSLTWYSQAYGGAVLATGSTFTPTPAPSTTTTYYVGVCPGTFRVPVVVTVNPNPTIAGSAVLTNPTCTTPGSITGLTVSGGTLGYTYAWNGTVTPGINYTNIPAGTYNLVLTDANGCTATSGPHTLVGTSGPIIDASAISIVNENCNGTLGSISGITATGTGLTYAWSPSGGNALNASGLTAGSYTLTVTDGNGCLSSSGPHLVGTISGPTVNATAIVLQNPTCGNSNGSITGITASGTALSFAWSPSGGNALNASNLGAGAYSLTVTDGNGCSSTSGPHNLVAIAGPTVNSGGVSIVNENCGQGNGSISGLVVNGGTPTISFAWTNTAQTTLALTNLTAGSYSLTVTDGNGCTASSGPFNVLNSGGPTLNELNAVTTNVLCSGTLGSISGITASGSALSYSWAPSGGSSLNATNLAAGTYTLTVTDGNGCSVNSAPYTINAPVSLSIDASNMITMPTGCASNSGSISGITIVGGINPTYTWTNTSATTLDLSNLAAGSYTLTVLDDQGCTDNLNVSITVMNAPTISIATMVISDEHCNQTDGAITGILVNGGTPGYSYSWNTSPPTLTASLTNVPSGTYVLTVTDAAGCTDTENVTVNEVAGPVINMNAAIVVQPTCNTNGSISGISVTGANPYTFSWTGTNQTTLDISNLSAGSYVLTVTDNNGCQSTNNATILTQPAGPTIDFDWNPSDPNIDETVSFTNTSSGNGLTNPIWTIDGQFFTSINAVYVFTQAGEYVVTLTEEDANGCEGTSSQIITIYDEIGIPNVITDNKDNINDRFEISGLKPNTEVVILNRWGEVVYSSTNYLNDWNGKDWTGLELTEGVYTYLVNTPDGKKYHGFVHLVR